MERKLTIFLVEDDSKACDEIVTYTEPLEDICVVEVTNNVKNALEFIKDLRSDIVILDLELSEGIGDGLTLLRDINMLDLVVKPYILVTTQNPSVITHDIARQLGADFIMPKYQVGYSAKTVVDFLRVLKPVLHNRAPNNTPSFVESPEQKRERLHRRICLELDVIGISPKVVGYQYLIDAIQLIMDKPVPNLCDIIGKNYGKTEYSVERAVQNAINKAWSSGDITELYKQYTAKIHSEKGVPTATEFIYYYANKLKNEY
jgi:Response regulator containing CheY-like receiver, AAA-type ATPase, and DNA-binding domains